MCMECCHETTLLHGLNSGHLEPLSQQFSCMDSVQNHKVPYHKEEALCRFSNWNANYVYTPKHQFMANLGSSIASILKVANFLYNSQGFPGLQNISTLIFIFLMRKRCLLCQFNWSGWYNGQTLNIFH